MKSIKEKEAELLEDFSFFDDWNQKYDYIISMGEDLPKLPDSEKNEQTRVEGCQSASWLKAEKRDDKLYFRGDSESILGRGVIAMLLNMLNGQRPEDIAAYDFRLVDAIDLRAHLSPVRQMGLAAVMERIKKLAHENV